MHSSPSMCWAGTRTTRPPAFSTFAEPELHRAETSTHSSPIVSIIQHTSTPRPCHQRQLPHVREPLARMLLITLPCSRPYLTPSHTVRTNKAAHVRSNLTLASRGRPLALQQAVQHAAASRHEPHPQLVPHGSCHSVPFRRRRLSSRSAALYIYAFFCFISIFEISFKCMY